MSVTFYQVTEGEFSRLVATKSIIKFIAQESEINPLKFTVVGVNPEQRLAYAMRHGRVNELRTWRLDNLAAYLKKLGVTNFEVQFNQS
ncbi:MAG: hypothetical protein HRU24_07870 [Gammaproteobacteria bacterium]|nr:hypothetical protein [Gammaproteobacteria bacterium]